MLYTVHTNHYHSHIWCCVTKSVAYDWVELALMIVAQTSCQTGKHQWWKDIGRGQYMNHKFQEHVQTNQIKQMCQPVRKKNGCETWEGGGNWRVGGKGLGSWVEGFGI